MANIIENVKRLFTPEKPLSPGLFHYQAPPDSSIPYRLHLRLEADGTGLLIVNASTVLHLNQTAAELAYHLIKQTPEEQMVRDVSRRYRVNPQEVLRDFRSINDRILTLIHTPDLDPEMYLDFERETPFSKKISAPYRLDCAITYRLPVNADASDSPTKRVTRELDTQEWYSIFDKAWDFGIPHLILTGGEPTLRDDLPDLIAHTEANGQVVGLLSDGLKLADDDYLNTLLQTGLDHLMFCLDPDDENSWHALEHVLSADLFVAVHHTITPQNAAVTSQTAARIANLGAKAISLSISDPSLEKTLVETRNQAAALGLSLVWNLPVPYSQNNPVSLEIQQDNYPEGAGHSWLYIEPDGDVLPSQGIDHVLGNILRDPWETLWR